MIKTLARLFRPAKPAPVIFDDMPAHKGFRVIVRYDYLTAYAQTFPTLAAAQAEAMRARASHAQRNDVLSRVWRHTPRAVQRISIQNLETGRFAPFKWQLTKAEVDGAAA